MQGMQRAQVAFHLTGSRLAPELESVEGLGLRPALFARYRDLGKLRYDFPLVLLEDGGVKPLSRLVDALLQEKAPPGAEGDRLRKEALQLEEGLRRRGSGNLFELLDGAPEVRDALPCDGELVDYHHLAPRRVVAHLWRAGQKARAARELAALDRLAIAMSEILEADFARSADGQTSDRLRSSFGSVHQSTFDFEALSKLLSRVSAERALSPSRRERVRRVLEVLRTHRPLLVEGAHPLIFDSCETALKSLRGRLPGIVELVKALAIAELEREGRYVEAEHDPFFESVDERALSQEDLARFPSTLICLDSATMLPGEVDLLMEVLASALPVKVLVVSDDVLAESPVGDGSRVPGSRNARLASLAVGLNEPFVLQVSGSHLYQVADRVVEGLAGAGTALFSVFAGSSYLGAAAAMESRAFPAFVFVPGARLEMLDNPQDDRDWPVHGFAYQDPGHRRVALDLAFTFVDYLAGDPRYASHFSRLSRADWNDTQLPVAEWLDLDRAEPTEAVPYVLMVDEQDMLHRVLVDSAAVAAARRIRAMWRSYRELARGPERILVHVQEPLPGVAEPVVAEEALAAEPPPAPAPAPAVERDPDEAYIETPRCSSCNECININPRMFAYNENKQAYIADLKAGTYKDLVDAAESCQVSIIRPGKPRDPSEPGVEALLERAQPFLV